METGFSIITNGLIYDFVEGTLLQLCHPHLMYGIGAYLEDTHDVTLHYEVINDEGKVSVLEVTVLFMPDLKYILLIPQDNFIELQILENPEGSFTMSW